MAPMLRQVLELSGAPKPTQATALFVASLLHSGPFISIGFKCSILMVSNLAPVHRDK